MRAHARSHREFFIDHLLVRIHFVIEMIRWTGLAPWEFESPFPGSLTSTFLARSQVGISDTQSVLILYRDTSLIRNSTPP